MEHSIRSSLTSRSSITDIVGSRIWPYYVPESNSSFPILVYRLVSNLHAKHQTGASGMFVARVQFDCMSDRLSEVVLLTQALRNELHGYRGYMGSDLVIKSQLENEIGFSDRPKNATDTWIYRRSIDYLISFKEGLPNFGTEGVKASGQALVAVM